MNSKGFELCRKSVARGFKNLKLIIKNDDNSKMTDDNL
jgi:hypothetical protein